jgi:hypothetical protein
MWRAIYLIILCRTTLVTCSRYRTSNALECVYISLYYLQRARTFTSAFEEMHLVGPGMHTEDVCAQLLKARKLIEAALECGVTDEVQCEVLLLRLNCTNMNIICLNSRSLLQVHNCLFTSFVKVTMICVELVVRDVRDLFLLFQEKLLASTRLHTILPGFLILYLRSGSFDKWSMATCLMAGIVRKCALSWHTLRISTMKASRVWRFAVTRSHVPAHRFNHQLLSRSL